MSLSVFFILLAIVSLPGVLWSVLILVRSGDLWQAWHDVDQASCPKMNEVTALTENTGHFGLAALGTLALILVAAIASPVSSEMGESFVNQTMLDVFLIGVGACASLLARFTLLDVNRAGSRFTELTGRSPAECVYRIKTSFRGGVVE